MSGVFSKSVYIMSWPELELIKIGKSNDPYARLRGFRALIPSLVLEYQTEITSHADRLEANMHREFCAHRTHGEFFKVPILTAVKMLAWKMRRLSELAIVTESLPGRIIYSKAIGPKLPKRGFRKRGIITIAVPSISPVTILLPPPILPVALERIIPPLIKSKGFKNWKNFSYKL